MSLDRLNKSLMAEVKAIHDQGRAKAPERVIEKVIPPEGDLGYRYRLRGYSGEYLRMNSNSYLGLSNDVRLIDAADKACRELGVGPGAVRFIDGTFSFHADLEKKIAEFSKKPAARIFSSAYTANLGLAMTLTDRDTYWIGDQLNHNSIIRALRISAVDRDHKGIYVHNDMDDLKRRLEVIPPWITRVLLIFDGIFSMRGDPAPIDKIIKIAEEYNPKYPDGVITIIDDSHGVGAYGATGRGTCEYMNGDADIIVGTLGKAFGCNGGYIAGSQAIVDAISQMCDTYIYTNPLAAGDCAASMKAIEILDSPEGLELLAKLKANTEQFRKGIKKIGLETIEGPHPIVPILVRDTKKTQDMVRKLFEKKILVVGLTFPVVPYGDETIRVQISAAHTKADIDYAIKSFSEVVKECQ
ncbi:MAG: aminotransferase class I/II-fold pyridoxal phosphate-dependent enzyme [Acidobacteria bacterium]|nr:aminotransferase class I/II-fold pyridoxal phosphate-dependent enzyme [Acidobacteriota bacterium]